MEQLICNKCNELKPEIAFELLRSGRPRATCRTCRSGVRMKRLHDKYETRFATRSYYLFSELKV